MLKKILSRIRRNHGLEHATIHMLSAKHQGFSAQGNSNHRGFHLNIYGDHITEDDVAVAVNEAFTRMKGGEHSLAVHPNCGTVLLTTATMTTIAAQAAFSVEQLRQNTTRNDTNVLIGGLPSAILASVIALIMSRPVGLHLQEKYTTEGDLGAMELVQIKQNKPNLVTRFFQLLLTDGKKKPKSFFVETIN